MRAKKDPRPYVMRGKADPEAAARERPTVLDEPDERVPAVHPRRLTPGEVRVICRETILDPRFRSTDRCFQRWTVTPGSGSALGMCPEIAHVRWACVSGQSDRPSALADRESRIIDHAVASADPWAKQFVTMWYRSGFSVAEIAAAMRIRRRQAVYDERPIVLSYFRGRLTQMGLNLPIWEPEA